MYTPFNILVLTIFATSIHTAAPPPLPNEKVVVPIITLTNAYGRRVHPSAFGIRKLSEKEIARVVRRRNSSKPVDLKVIHIH